MKKLHYESSGDNYKFKDPFKLIALNYSQKTKNNLKRFKRYGLEIVDVSQSRGESAYRIQIKSGKLSDFQLAHVEESIGTKNIIADELATIYGKSFYFNSAIDNAACIFNDLSTCGAFPLTFMLHVAAYPNEWYADLDRWKGLIEGTAAACDMAGASWGGGESATDRDIIIKGKSLLSGSATGIIFPSSKALSEENLRDGDRIILLKSSGVHANGITLLRRELLKRLPKGYKTKLSDGSTYGEALITQTVIYSKLVEEAILNCDVHYAVHITGHGWRKIMRAKKPFCYMIEGIPVPQPIYGLIKKYSDSSEKDMYDTYNMGAGFALFVPRESVQKIMQIAKKNKIQALDAGFVQKGPKQVVIKPLGLTFTTEDMSIR
ncbi:phosphoribosylformylglycinamidine cyclo-ligase [Candidatus Daviesbacteria bacterium]|nr:phosphoribosylformylglycinamidine cyclo-ligase [Candidatus Daviesbacteria bacterium]